MSLADHNGDALQLLLDEGETFIDWVATIAFYRAVHLFDALLYKQFQSHGANHGHRSDMIKQAYSSLYKH